MKIERFEDIVAWQKAEKLVLACYKEFRSLRTILSKIRYAERLSR